MDGADKLQGIGFDITDEWIGAILLTGLTDKFQPLIMALEATNNELKSDVIISKLLDAQVASNSEASGFFSKRNWKSGRKGKSGKNESNPKCKNCGRIPIIRPGIAETRRNVTIVEKQITSVRIAGSQKGIQKVILTGMDLTQMMHSVRCRSRQRQQNHRWNGLYTLEDQNI